MHLIFIYNLVVIYMFSFHFHYFFSTFLSFFFFFFFSSRRRHTRSLCDWSSDVCSSDLVRPASVKSKVTFGWLVVGSKFCCGFLMSVPPRAGRSWSTNCGDFESSAGDSVRDGLVGAVARSEERRVGKECRGRGWPGRDRE